MALVVKDRVKETTATTGLSDFVLGGTTTGFQSFSVIGNANTTYYTAVDPVTGDWEVGVGTYSTTGPTLTRDTILESSAGGSKVNFGGGNKDVFCTYPAEKAVMLNETNNVTALGTVSSGTWQGSTVAVAYGGTGSTTASGARTNLGAQETLVSGTNIKTVNCTSLLGSGNISVSVACATPTVAGKVFGRTDPAGLANNTALGYCASTTSSGSVAIGHYSGAVGSCSVAVGYSTFACSTGAVSVGTQSSSATYGVAVGAAAIAGGYGISIGRYASSGSNGIAIGECTSANYFAATAIGFQTTATGSSQTHIGPIRNVCCTAGYTGLFYCSTTKEVVQGAAGGGGVCCATPTVAGKVYGTTTASSPYITALGYNAASPCAYQATLVGVSAIAYGANAMAIGAYSGSGCCAIAIGNNTSSGGNSVAVGNNVLARGCGSIVIGNGATEEPLTLSNIVIGQNAKAWYFVRDSVVIGGSAFANCCVKKAVVIGYSANISTFCGNPCSRSVAIGGNANAGAFATSIGGASSTADYGTAVGRGAYALNCAVAVGFNANAGCCGIGSIAIGKNAYAGWPNSTAIGTSVLATGSNQTHISPIRNVCSTSGLQGLFYNSSTKEVVRGSAGGGGSSAALTLTPAATVTAVGTTSLTITLEANPVYGWSTLQISPLSVNVMFIYGARSSSPNLETAIPNGNPPIDVLINGIYCTVFSGGWSEEPELYFKTLNGYTIADLLATFPDPYTGLTTLSLSFLRTTFASFSAPLANGQSYVAYNGTTKVPFTGNGTNTITNVPLSTGNSIYNRYNTLYTGLTGTNWDLFQNSPIGYPSVAESYAVGSYQFFICNSDTNVDVGQVVPGSSLVYTNNAMPFLPFGSYPFQGFVDYNLSNLAVLDGSYTSGLVKQLLDAWGTPPFTQMWVYFNEDYSTPFPTPNPQPYLVVAESPPGTWRKVSMGFSVATTSVYSGAYASYQTLTLRPLHAFVRIS